MMPPTSRALSCRNWPALAHAIDRHAPIKCTAGDGADGRIHARGVTTTRKDGDVLHESEIMTVCPADRQKKCRLATIVRKMPLTNQLPRQTIRMPPRGASRRRAIACHIEVRFFGLFASGHQ